MEVGRGGPLLTIRYAKYLTCAQPEYEVEVSLITLIDNLHFV